MGFFWGCFGVVALWGGEFGNITGLVWLKFFGWFICLRMSFFVVLLGLGFCEDRNWDIVCVIGTSGMGC